MRKNEILLPLLLALSLTVPLSASGDTTLCQFPSHASEGRGHRLFTVEGNAECPRTSRRVTQLPNLFGDGSNNNLNVDGGTRLTVDGVGREYHNIRISHNSTLVLRSGSLIRCTGTFENRGRVEVLPGASGSTRYVAGSSLVAPGGRPAHPGGVALAPASDGLVSFTLTAHGGPAGVAHTVGSTAQIRLPTHGGGGGGSGLTDSASREQVGGSGGGSAKILCARIDNRGTISAVGEDGLSYGGGGGAGGMLILGASSGVLNSGTITVVGGDGAAVGAPNDNAFAVAAGGGGAGGHVQIVALAYTNTGTIDVSGGSAGANFGVDPTGALMRAGGGQGGSLFASGGRGGSIVDGAFQGAQNGGAGEIHYLRINPLEISIGY